MTRSIRSIGAGTIAAVVLALTACQPGVVPPIDPTPAPSKTLVAFAPTCNGITAVADGIPEGASAELRGKSEAKPGVVVSGHTVITATWYELEVWRDFNAGTPVQFSFVVTGSDGVIIPVENGDSKYDPAGCPPIVP